MNLTQFRNVTLFALIVGLVAGCAKNKAGVTPLPDAGMTGTGTQTTPDQSGKLPGSDQGVKDMSVGIPMGPGHQGWTENAETFKADTVHFDYDSSVVRANDKSKIEAVANQLKSNSASAVRVAGHTDERGTEEYNRSLGERRALAIREELIKLGIEATRVDTISYGEDRPLSKARDEASRALNRRGEFVELTAPK